MPPSHALRCTTAVFHATFAAGFVLALVVDQETKGATDDVTAHSRSNTLFTDDFPGSSLRTTLWQPLADGANFKGQTYTFPNSNPYTDFERRRLSDGEQQHGSICAADLGQCSIEKPDDHAFMGTEALTIAAWNPTTGGLSFEGKFKFSGEGNGIRRLTQGGMIIGFFTYQKQPPGNGFHTEIDFEVFTSNLKNPDLNQISTNVFNGLHDLKIWTRRPEGHRYRLRPTVLSEQAAAQCGVPYLQVRMVPQLDQLSTSTISCCGRLPTRKRFRCQPETSNFTSTSGAQGRTGVPPTAIGSGTLWAIPRSDRHNPALARPISLTFKRSASTGCRPVSAPPESDMLAGSAQ